MIETLLLSILFVCAVIVIVSSIMVIREKMIIDSSINKLCIPKSQYANLVLKWCISRINHAQIKKPHLIVSSEMNNRIWGVYRPSKNEIVIYVNKHRTIRELTNTIIHEFVHATQKNRSFNTSYVEFNKPLAIGIIPMKLSRGQLQRTRKKNVF